MYEIKAVLEALGHHGLSAGLPELVEEVVNRYFARVWLGNVLVYVHHLKRVGGRR